jgi:hypothetical protein
MDAAGEARGGMLGGVKRRLFAIAAGISLLTGLGSLGLIIRGHWHFEMWGVKTANESATLVKMSRIFLDGDWIEYVWNRTEYPDGSAGARVGNGYFHEELMRPGGELPEEEDDHFVMFYDSHRRKIPAELGSGRWEHEVQFSVHLWPVAFLSLVLPIGWLFAALRRRRLLNQGRCPACGYDLRASKDRCPECGKAIARSEIVRNKS